MGKNNEQQLTPHKTNEIGLEQRNLLLVDICKSGEIELDAGSAVIIGFFRSGYVVPLFNEGFINYIYCVDTNVQVSNTNVAILEQYGYGSQSLVINQPIQAFKPERKVTIVDWTNAWMWMNLKQQDVDQKIMRAKIHLLSDFIDGRIFLKICNTEPVTRLRNFALSFYDDFAIDPRTPQSMKIGRSLLSLATTLPFEDLY